MTIETKEDLLAEMKRLGACKEATEWVESQDGVAGEIWRKCENVSWLIWFGGRRNPRAIAGFARRCADRAKEYAERAADADAADAAADAAAYYAAYYADAYAAYYAADAAAAYAAYYAAERDKQREDLWTAAEAYLGA